MIVAPIGPRASASCKGIAKIDGLTDRSVCPTFPLPRYPHAFACPPFVCYPETVEVNPQSHLPSRIAGWPIPFRKTLNENFL